MEAAITALKESDPYLFEETPPPGTGGSLGGGQRKNRQAITKEEFNKMGYTERNKLFTENPNLYNELKG